MLKIHYPYIIRNEDLYSRVQMNTWSQVIQSRRMKWLGHLIRMDERAPASIALQELSIKRGKSKKGNKLTWIKLINNDLKQIHENLHIFDSSLFNLTQEREEWNKITRMKFHGSVFKMDGSNPGI